MCAAKTRANPINMTIGTTPQEILGPNPKRKAILFQPVLPGVGVANAISLSHRSDVVAGQGTINYVTGEHYDSVISDNDIGDAICLPWYVVSGQASQTIQITEYSYDS